MVQENANEGANQLRLEELRKTLDQLKQLSGLSTLRNDVRTQPPQARDTDHPLLQFLRLDSLAPSTSPDRPQPEQTKLNREQIIKLVEQSRKNAVRASATWDEQMTAAALEYYLARERLPNDTPERNAIEAGANMHMTRLLTNMYGATEFITTFELYVRYLEAERNAPALAFRNAAMENRLLADGRTLVAIMPYWGRAVQLHFLTIQNDQSGEHQAKIKEARVQLEAARKIAVAAGVEIPAGASTFAPAALMQTISPIEKRLRGILFEETEAVTPPRHDPSVLESAAANVLTPERQKQFRAGVAAIGLTETEPPPIQARRVRAIYLNLLVEHRRAESDRFIKEARAGRIPPNQIGANFQRHREITNLIMQEHLFGLQSTTTHMYAGTLGVSTALQQNPEARLNPLTPDERDKVFAQFLALMVATESNADMQEGLQKQREVNAKALQNYIIYMRTEALQLRTQLSVVDRIYISPAVQDATQALATITNFIENWADDIASWVLWGPLLMRYFPGLKLGDLAGTNLAGRRKALNEVRNQAEANLKRVQSLASTIATTQKSLQAAENDLAAPLKVITDIQAGQLTDPENVKAAQAALKRIAEVDQRVGKTVEDLFNNVNLNMEQHGKTASIIEGADNSWDNIGVYALVAVSTLLVNFGYTAAMAGRHTNIFRRGASLAWRLPTSVVGGVLYIPADLTRLGLQRLTMNRLRGVPQVVPAAAPEVLTASTLQQVRKAATEFAEARATLGRVRGTPAAGAAQQTFQQKAIAFRDTLNRYSPASSSAPSQEMLRFQFLQELTGTNILQGPNATIRQELLRRAHSFGVAVQGMQHPTHVAIQKLWILQGWDLSSAGVDGVPTRRLVIDGVAVTEQAAFSVTQARMALQSGLAGQTAAQEVLEATIQSPWFRQLSPELRKSISALGPEGRSLIVSLERSASLREYLSGLRGPALAEALQVLRNNSQLSNTLSSLTRTEIRNVFHAISRVVPAQKEAFVAALVRQSPEVIRNFPPASQWNSWVGRLSAGRVLGVSFVLLDVTNESFMLYDAVNDRARMKQIRERLEKEISEIFSEANGYTRTGNIVRHDLTVNGKAPSDLEFDLTGILTMNDQLLNAATADIAISTAGVTVSVLALVGALATSSAAFLAVPATLAMPVLIVVRGEMNEARARKFRRFINTIDRRLVSFFPLTNEGDDRPGVTGQSTEALVRYMVENRGNYSDHGDIRPAVGRVVGAALYRRMLQVSPVPLGLLDARNGNGSAPLYDFYMGLDARMGGPPRFGGGGGPGGLYTITQDRNADYTLTIQPNFEERITKMAQDHLRQFMDANLEYRLGRLVRHERASGNSQAPEGVPPNSADILGEDELYVLRNDLKILLRHRYPPPLVAQQMLTRELYTGGQRSDVLRSVLFPAAPYAPLVYRYGDFPEDPDTDMRFALSQIVSRFPTAASAIEQASGTGNLPRVVQLRRMTQNIGGMEYEGIMVTVIRSSERIPSASHQENFFAWRRTGAILRALPPQSFSFEPMSNIQLTSLEDARKEYVSQVEAGIKSHEEVTRARQSNQVLAKLAGNDVNPEVRAANLRAGLFLNGLRAQDGVCTVIESSNGTPVEFVVRQGEFGYLIRFRDGAYQVSQGRIETLQKGVLSNEAIMNAVTRVPGTTLGELGPAEQKLAREMYEAAQKSAAPATTPGALFAALSTIPGSTPDAQFSQEILNQLPGIGLSDLDRQTMQQQIMMLSRYPADSLGGQLYIQQAVLPVALQVLDPAQRAVRIPPIPQVINTIEDMSHAMQHIRQSLPQ